MLNPNEKTILHIPNVNSRKSTKDKIKEVEHILDALATGSAPTQDGLSTREAGGW